MDTTTPTLRSVALGPPDTAATLARLLDAELAFDTDAHHGFTSHLAMGLVAAARLGAGPATLDRWFEAETAEGYLRARPERPPWLDEGLERIREHGIEVEVRARLGDLVDRIGGFFHWMIRLELAIDAGHAGQVANALGDWHRRPRPDPAMLPAPSGTRPVAEVLHQLWSANRSLASEGDEGGNRSEARRRLVAEAADGPDLLDEVAAFVADLHWALDGFGTLHLVTGTRAARALVPYLDDEGRRRLAHAHLHAVASVLARTDQPSQPPDPIPASATLPDWDAIGVGAVATGDDHMVKLAYAAQLEEAATDRALYRAIAARAAGLL